jgi:hypothetical protein
MARIRSIKPEFWKSESIACHDMFTRLVFIGLWTYVDDNGVGLDNPKLVAAELFPLEEDFAGVSRDLRESLARLADTGRIRRYTVDGKAYLAIVNWSEHQKIDRPAKARYPEPDDPRATPTPPPSRGNARPPGIVDAPSRGSRESVASPHRLDQGTGDQGTGIREQGTTALASLGGAPVEGEIVDDPPPPDPASVALFAVPAGTDLDIAEPSNAGQLNRQWIDYCHANGVKLSNSVIKRYGGKLRQALDDGFDARLVKHALGAMFKDRVASRPALLDNYLVRVQQGPELPPERLSRHQADAERRAAEAGTTATQRLYDTLTRPA